MTERILAEVKYVTVYIHGYLWYVPRILPIYVFLHNILPK